MAEQLTPEQVLNEKKKYPDCMTVAYVNTTAELKAVSDVCVTSSSAVEIVHKLPARDVLFIPDVNWGLTCSRNVPKRNYISCGAAVPSMRVSPRATRRSLRRRIRGEPSLPTRM